MKLLAKNNWHNLIFCFLGFVFFHSLMETVMKRYGRNMMAVTETTSQISTSYYWLVIFALALLLSLVLVFIFCKPRAPFFVSLAVLCGGVYCMYDKLYTAIVKLNSYVQAEGLGAFWHLLPHGSIILGAVIAYFLTSLGNQN